MPIAVSLRLKGLVYLLDTSVEFLLINIINGCKIGYTPNNKRNYILTSIWHYNDIALRYNRLFYNIHVIMK